MTGPDCPVHQEPLETVATTNEWRYYCAKCDRRYNQQLQQQRQ